MVEETVRRGSDSVGHRAGVLWTKGREEGRQAETGNPSGGFWAPENCRCGADPVDFDGEVCFVILKAREFDVKDSPTVPYEGSNPADDQMVEVLEDRGDDPVVWELAAFIGAMNEDEQIDLVTLTWLGRGDGSLQEWDELRAEAARSHNRHTVLYLLRTPLLPDYLEDGIAEFGRSCEDFEREHL
jgi:hypothetical protein